jgi:hypothetical protein
MGGSFCDVHQQIKEKLQKKRNSFPAPYDKECRKHGGKQMLSV